jgi:pimeloyl-ACP methyl ester carboxylesterase
MPVLLMQGETSPRRYQEIVRAADKCLRLVTRAVIPEAGHAMHRMNPGAFQSELIKLLSK